MTPEIAALIAEARRWMVTARSRGRSESRGIQAEYLIRHLTDALEAALASQAPAETVILPPKCVMCGSDLSVACKDCQRDTVDMVGLPVRTPAGAQVTPGELAGVLAHAERVWHRQVPVYPRPKPFWEVIASAALDYIKQKG